MKHPIRYFMAFLLIAAFPACGPQVVAVDINVQLFSDDAPLAQEGITIVLSDAGGNVTFGAVTDASGTAAFKVNPGSYTASATFKSAEDGKLITLNGSNTNIDVTGQSGEKFLLILQKVEIRQLIIKEFYTGGCPKNDNSGAFTDDKYIIIYNNSEVEADASDVVIGAISPYNANASNKYFTKDGLVYENDSWLPAGGVVWYFTSPVKIPAYSQIVVAVFGAIDHTSTVTASVNLANPDYYWMSNADIPAITNAKYVVSDVIPPSHYLSGYQINRQNAWTISNTAPALFMAIMGKSELEALCTNTADYDLTAGTNDISWAVKMPKANIIGALEVYAAASLEACHPRFSSDVNTGHIVMTGQLGYTIYRNVDKEATEALPENEGKLVYNYSGGTEDVGGSTDPSGIDAEASIAAGAHIIYLQTNDSGKDYHQRRIASLKQ